MLGKYLGVDSDAGPAHRAGIQPGDLLVAADDQLGNLMDFVSVVEIPLKELYRMDNT